MCLQDRESSTTSILSAGLPHLACILLWYPLFTQPFIFREIEGLKAHLPMRIYTLYARDLRHCSEEMRAASSSVRSFGARFTFIFLWEFCRFALIRPLFLFRIFRHCLCRRWPDLEIFGENLWAFLAGLHLGRIFREEGMDMIYAPWPRGTATAAWVASQIAGIPYVTVARGDNLAPADPDLADKLQAALFVRANNAADKQRIVDFLPQDRCVRVELVYNSLTLPKTVSQISDMVRQIRASGEPVRLLALGRFDVTKGFDILLRACALLRERGLPFRLTLAGGGGKLMGLGALEEGLTKLRATLGLVDMVQMPGLVSHDDLPQLMAEHDIFVAPCVVHPSGRRDGIPNTVIEALSQAMPVVCTTVNALPEVVHDGKNGLTVPPGDHEALADAIERLASDPELARQMGLRGAELAQEMFDPLQNSRRLAELFSSHYYRWKRSCAV